MNKDIEQALTNFRSGNERYAKATRYYDGEHDLAFATEKFQNTFGNLFREFALNLCPVVCDAVRDKLRVTGFGVEAVGTQAASLRVEKDTQAGSLRSDTRAIWMRNRMRTRAGEVHKEALKTGDAYLIVWPDEKGRAVLYPNRAANVTVVTDDDSPGRVLWAAKQWLTGDKHIRLNLFYPDRIEKYVSKTESEGSLPDVTEFVPLTERTTPSAKRGHPSFVRRGAGEQPDAAVMANPFGVVPVFHFANNADLGTTGRSELEAAIPVQDGLNKSVLDMLVAMEFSAYRQRWAAGVAIEIDAEGKAVAPLTAGVEHLWISENPNARLAILTRPSLSSF